VRALERGDIKPQAWAVTGAYYLRLYCLHPKHQEDENASREAPQTYGDVPVSPSVLAADTRSEALQDARKQGWYISRDEQRVLCPYHAIRVPK